MDTFFLKKQANGLTPARPSNQPPPPPLPPRILSAPPLPRPQSVPPSSGPIRDIIAAPNMAEPRRNTIIAVHAGPSVAPVKRMITSWTSVDEAPWMSSTKTTMIGTDMISSPRSIAVSTDYEPREKSPGSDQNHADSEVQTKKGRPRGRRPASVAR